MPRKFRKPTFGVCRVCGCTDNAACEEGCSWVDRGHTLCSACAGTPADLAYDMQRVARLLGGESALNAIKVRPLALQAHLIAKDALLRFNRRQKAEAESVIARPPEIANTAGMTVPAYAIAYGWSPRIPGCHPFMGAHNFERGGHERPWQRGVSMALFKTQSDARDSLKVAKRKNARAKVAKVSVSVRWREPV